MLYILLEYVVYLLAVYGLLVLVIGSAELVRCRISGCRPKVRIVLLVKDVEENIEYIIRNAVKKDFASKVLSDKNIAIVDMNSADHTYELLEKLQKDFLNIEVLKFEEKTIIFDDFSVFSPIEK